MYFFASYQDISDNNQESWGNNPLYESQPYHIPAYLPIEIKFCVNYNKLIGKPKECRMLLKGNTKESRKFYKLTQE